MLRVAATEITTATAKYKQRITGNNVVANLIADRAWRVTWRVQHLNRAVTERNFVTAVMQARLVEFMLPKFIFRLKQVHFGAGMIQYALNTVDMIVVAVREQNIGDVQAELICSLDDSVDIPGRIDYRCTP